MPESVRDENDAEVTGRMGDTPIHKRLGNVSLSANLSECWHDVYSAGQGKRCYLSKNES